MSLRSVTKILLLFLVILTAPAAVQGETLVSVVSPGLNLVPVPPPLAAGYVSAFPLLQAWKGAGVTAIETADPAGSVLRAELDPSGSPTGSDFPLPPAVFVHSASSATLDLGTRSCTSLTLAPGANLVGFACFPDPYFASEALRSWGLGNVASISRLDPGTGAWQTAGVDAEAIVGDDFLLRADEGYLVQAAGTVSGWVPPVPVVTGLSPPSLDINSPPAVIDVAGALFRSDSVVSIDGTAVATTYLSDTLLRFTVPSQAAPTTLAIQVRNPDSWHQGGGFDSLPVSLPVKSPTAAVVPSALSVWQGAPATNLTVEIPFAAPAGGLAFDVAASDPALLAVPASVTVAAGATTATFAASAADTGATAPQAATVTVSRAGWNVGSATVDVRPKPTANLAPVSTLTGLTFTYLLSVNLSDQAPPGGLDVALSASPAGIVSLPATVTVPAGATTAQVTVTATAVGTATITASAPGRIFAGSQNAVSVKPIQTVGYGPVVTAPVGVAVGAAAPSPAPSTYGPVTSRAVGIAVGSAVTGLSPAAGSVGSYGLAVTVNGNGLAGVTGIAFEPSTGITVIAGSLSVAGDGSSATVLIDIDAGAPISDRTVVVTAGSNAIRGGSPGATTFKVTRPPAQLLSIIPIYGVTGTTFAFRANGRDLYNASAISFSPPDGIQVGNPPTVSADGTLASVNVAIDAAAAATERIVTITTATGTTTSVPSPANAFQVRTPATAGTEYTPLVSGEVGVFVPSAAGAPAPVTYAPSVSQQVGVVVGSTLTGIVPATGAIGATGLTLKVTGVGLSAATGIAFEPSTGITVRAGSFAIDGDGNPTAVVDIDPTAPTTVRTVVVSLPSGSAPPASPGANVFRVTLPEPEILSIQPIRAMVGQMVNLTIFGKNLASATRVDFAPSTGVAVNNPPSVSPDGTLATVTLSIAAGAPLGDRIVTVTTPGWTTSTVPSAANTFRVTADSGTTYTPLLSLPVGVDVAPPAAPTVVDTYGPVASLPVGIMVVPAPGPTNQTVAYGPTVSAAVGVAVGGAVTGAGPRAVEPGGSSTVTLTGAGLDLVTSLTVVPPDGITVGTWTPAPDGLSGTVAITADPAAATGKRTLVAKTATGTIFPATPDAPALLVGYRPAINSIVPTLPTVGTSFTLTINGLHLQGTTRVEIVPGDGVAVDAIPVWSSDGTGEHVVVKVVIDAAAAPGDRVVVVTTPYGVTTVSGSPANTITFFKPMAKNEADQARRAVAQAPTADFRGEGKTLARFGGDGCADLSLCRKVDPAAAEAAPALLSSAATRRTAAAGVPAPAAAVVALGVSRGPPENRPYRSDYSEGGST